MVKFLKACAFVLVVVMMIAAIRPLSGSDTTYAAERTPHAVRIRDGNRDRGTHETLLRTVGEVLAEQGIELHPNDQVIPAYSRRINQDMVVQINRAFYVQVNIDGEQHQYKVSPGTRAGEVLNAMQAEMETALLFEGDEDEELTERSVLDFYTWRSELETIVEEIPYTSEYHNTPSLSLGTDIVRQEGIPGERHSEYMVVYISNEEYSRELQDEFTIEPTTRIVDRGVGGTLTNLGALTDTSCPTFRYLRRLTMNASAYTAGYTCTGKTPQHPLYGITASGKRVQHGIVAVDPSIIPLGTRLYVEGYGFSIAADTGSAIIGYKIDLFMYDLSDARRFGRRDITVFVLD